MHFQDMYVVLSALKKWKKHLESAGQMTKKETDIISAEQNDARN